MEHSCASQLRTGGNQEIWKECDPISSKVKLVLGPGAPVYLARERLPDHRVVVGLSHPLARALTPGTGADFRWNGDMRKFASVEALFHH